MSKITRKRQAWIEEYLTCWNATEAARRVGFANPNTQGPRLLLDVGIQEMIKARVSEKAMSSDEVLLRLAEHSRGDYGDFLDITPMGFQIDLNKAKEKGLTHLIKKAKMRTTTTLSKDGVETETNDIEIELYDAQAALVQLGRYHKLFTDKSELTGADGKRITINLTWGEDASDNGFDN